MGFFYIFFEINLIKELGFDTNLKTYSNSLTKDDLIINIKIDDIKYEVPVYLIEEKIPLDISGNMIKKSLLFTRSILLNKFFIPNNLPFPKSRIIFENYFS